MKGIQSITCGVFFIMAMLLTWSCTQKKEGSAVQGVTNQLPDNAAGKVVKKAIDVHGGLQNWNNKKTLSYLKTIQHYDSTGALTGEQEQLHQYQLQPQFKAHISWNVSGNRHVIINNGTDAWQLINGERSKKQKDINQAWNSSFGSHYVVSMPFKLTDPGVNLVDMGSEMLPAGKPVRSIKVIYDKDAGSAGGKHIWFYFFDPETHRLAANFLDYGDGYSFTTYKAFKEVDGILFSEKRVSRAADKHMQLAPDSTVYINSNIQFDVTLPDSLFN